MEVIDEPHNYLLERKRISNLLTNTLSSYYPPICPYTVDIADPPVLRDPWLKSTYSRVLWPGYLRSGVTVRVISGQAAYTVRVSYEKEREKLR